MPILRRIPAVVLLLCLAIPGRADLAAYFAKPEPLYKWEKRGEQTSNGCKVYDLHLVSQEWQGIKWEHRLQVFYPEKIEHPEFCTIYNTGGSGSAGNTAMGIRLAKATGCVYAILLNIPNQPLYGGLSEDALIVYTWLKYIETGDESWPLHFPMAKAVLKSMYAIQELAKAEKLKPVTGFLINGGSKRGWTTWLAGASRDPRIKAIAPMVIDILNVIKQGPHQLEAYGKPSEQIGDYTSAGVQEKLETPQGRRLMELEDPYSYREILTLPKLLILGTNDRYWSQDALNLYWDDLRGPKWVMYTPNSGHGLEDRDRVYSTLAGFVRMVAGHKKWPKMRWGYKTAKDGTTSLSVSSSITPLEGRLFHVHASTKDFRDSKWTFNPMALAGNRLSATYPPPASGYDAIFGEAVFRIDDMTFTLSTQIRILGAGPPARSSGRTATSGSKPKK